MVRPKGISERFESVTGGEVGETMAVLRRVVWRKKSRGVSSLGAKKTNKLVILMCLALVNSKNLTEPLTLDQHRATLVH